MIVVLLIMRISQINDKLTCIDEQLSDCVTHKFLTDYVENRHTKKEDMINEVEELKKRMNKHDKTHKQTDQ